MKSSQRKSAPLGEVVAAVFDQAECYITKPADVARVASFAVMRLWLRSSQALASRPLPEAVKQVLQ